MIISYELKGSKGLHKGCFETTGFWATFQEDREHIVQPDGQIQMGEIEGYKIYSHFSFAFYHEDKTIVDAVFQGLVGALSGIDWEFPGVGFIREVC